MSLPWGVSGARPTDVQKQAPSPFVQAIVTTADLSCLPVKNRSSSPSR